MLLAGLLLIAPMVWAGQLMEEREQHTDALQQREDQLQALSHRLEIALQTSRIGVWEYHVDDGKLIWDDRMRDLYDIDLDKEACTYEDWERALHPDDLARASADFNHALTTGSHYGGDFRVITRTGEVRYVRTIGNVITESNARRRSLASIGTSRRTSGCARNWKPPSCVRRAEPRARDRAQSDGIQRASRFTDAHANRR